MGIIYLAAILVRNASWVVELNVEFRIQFHHLASIQNQDGLEVNRSHFYRAQGRGGETLAVKGPGLPNPSQGCLRLCSGLQTGCGEGNQETGSTWAGAAAGIT